MISDDQLSICIFGSFSMGLMGDIFSCVTAILTPTLHCLELPYFSGMYIPTPSNLCFLIL